MNEQYNQPKEKFPALTIERHQIMFQAKTEHRCFLWSANIYTPLYHFSEGKWTLPLWRKEVCWELFLEGDSDVFEKKSNTITENPTSAE
jgi:hypothetical protein